MSKLPSELRCLHLSPHPSREGRGLFLGGCMWLAANQGGEGEGSGGKVVVGWVEDERISTVMGLIWVLNSARSPRLRWI